MKDNNKILREYVRTVVAESDESVIVEDAWGGDFGFGGDWMGPLTNKLLGVGKEGGGLLGPFLDVGKTALAGVLDVTNRVWGLLKVTLTAVTNAVIPWWDRSYDNINNLTKDRSKKIRSRFQHVFDRTGSAMENDDFKTTMLLINPAGYLLAKAAETVGPKAAGAGVEAQARVEKKLSMLQDLLVTFTGVGKVVATPTENKLVRYNKDLILERADASDIKRAVEESQLADEMQQAGIEILKARLKDIINDVNKIEQIDSLDQLQSLMKKDFKLANVDKLEDKDEDEAKAEILNTAKRDYKKMHSAALEVEADMIQKMAGDRASDVLSLYASVIAKLNK